MKKLKQAEKPHLLHVNLYPSEWRAIKAEAKGTSDDYATIIRRAVRSFFAIEEKSITANFKNTKNKKAGY